MYDEIWFGNMVGNFWNWFWRFLNKISHKLNTLTCEYAMWFTPAVLVLKRLVVHTLHLSLAQYIPYSVSSLKDNYRILTSLMKVYIYNTNLLHVHSQVVSTLTYNESSHRHLPTLPDHDTPGKSCGEISCCCYWCEYMIRKNAWRHYPLLMWITAISSTPRVHASKIQNCIEGILVFL